MKIALLNLYQGGVERGAETFVLELSRRLSKKYKVDEISGYSALKTRWPFLWRVFLDPPGLAVLSFTIKNLGKIWKEKYDIVVPLNGGWQPAFIRLITWIYGGKMVVSGQSGMGWDDRNNLWCFPDRFSALTKKAEKWAKKAMPLVQTEYIPNGVDLKKFTPHGEIYSSGLKKPIILCVGALVEQKRIDLVIKAVSKLKDASLLVVGDGELKEKLTEMGKKLLGNRFHLIKISFEDMPKVYRNADVFTLVPESSEAFGVVFAEALATNLPVVTIDDEQRKEIIGKAGLYVEPENTGQYAKALRATIDYDWKDKPRKQAEKFDWDRIAERYEKLFVELVRK